MKPWQPGHYLYELHGEQKAAPQFALQKVLKIARTKTEHHRVQCKINTIKEVDLIILRMIYHEAVSD